MTGELNRILLIAGLKATSVAVGLVTAFCMFVLGDAYALGALIGGIIASADFLFLIHLVGRLLDPARTSGKGYVLALIMVKFLIVFAVLYVVIELIEGIHAMGLGLGFLAALMGLTLGLNGASQSARAQALMEMEEESGATKNPGDGGDKAE